MILVAHRCRTAIVIVMLLASASAWAQDVGTIAGTVRDQTAGTLPGASVTLRDAATAAVRTTVSDRTGYFQFQQVRPGTFELRIELSGFKTATRLITLLTGSSVTSDVTLEVGTATEYVVVEAPTLPTLNRLDASIGTAITETEVRASPFLARNPVNLLTLQPGVVFSGQSDTDLLSMGTPAPLDRREGVVNGTRGNQGFITIDGLDANDWQNQAAFTSALPLTLDSLQEFRVTTAASTAAVGVGSGAQVALVTKSGSNTFRGNGRWYGRDEQFAANSFFNNRVGLAKPTLNRNIGGGSLGGPIRTNRAFFFFDAEWRRDTSEETVVRRVPTASMRQGTLTYLNDANAVVSLDANQLRALDPLGLGPSAAVLQFLSQFPAGNDVSGGDGLNSTGYRFNAPVQTDSDIFTIRLDANLTADGRQRVEWRGSLGDIDRDLSPQQFPGLPPNATLLNRSRGFVGGWTAQLGQRAINTFRAGLTRQNVAQTGSDVASWIMDRTLGNLTNTQRASGRIVDSWEIKNDLSWERGAHSFQAGGTFRFVTFNQNSNLRSFPAWLSTSDCCTAISNAILADADPSNDPLNANTVSGDFGVLHGIIDWLFGPTILVDPGTLAPLPAGSALDRQYVQRATEAYLQDTWRLRSTLTLSLGLRYGVTPAPYEARGAQVRPTIDVRAWWAERLRNMEAGVPSDASQLLAFDLAGDANDRPSWWSTDWNDFDPRIAITWSPSSEGGWVSRLLGGPGSSVIRAGFGVYHDRLGGPTTVAHDEGGNFGFSTLLRGAFGWTEVTAPRFSGTCDLTGCAGFPSFERIGAPVPPPSQFPNTPSPIWARSGFLVDTELRTPYSMNATVSLQRELPRGTTWTVGYVGNFGRDLLLKPDFAQGLGAFRDPASGQTLWQAQNRVADLIGPDPFRPQIDPRNLAGLGGIGVIPFAENLMPNLPAYLATLEGDPRYASLTPSQAFFAYIGARAPQYADALEALDVPFSEGHSPWGAAVDPEQNGFVLFQPQFWVLPAWTNWGHSDYHSLQVSVRRNLGRHLFGANYVLSKSTDNGSSFENLSSIDVDFGSTAGIAPDAIDPDANTGPSDFDLRHNFNAHWVLDLPFGNGRAVGRNAGPALDALIGGWQLSGVWRWRSGFPLSTSGINRTTLLFTNTPAALVSPIATDVTSADAAGVPNLFADPDRARAAFTYARPGSVGSRNVLRAPAYSVVDLGLNKSVRVPWASSHRFEVRVTAFNAFNTVNFSSTDIDLRPTSATFGRIRSTAGPRGGARELEFAVRYQF
jgi:hypothetical protein